MKTEKRQAKWMSCAEINKNLANERSNERQKKMEEIHVEDKSRVFLDNELAKEEQRYDA
jgi:hypothetical protein